MKALSSIFAVAILFTAGAAPVLAAGDAVAGKEKSALCQGCHGETGNSASADFPKLAGQPHTYIFKQVTDFQNERRLNETMQPMAATVASLEDLHDIAAYFSSQKMGKNDGSFDAKKVKAGEDIFLNGNAANGVYGCVNCHGENGKGNQVFPRIGQQWKDYLVRQLKALKKGERANDRGGMMRDIAQKLSDQEIDNVTEFLASIK
jgi:cytochrome c553